MRVFRIIVIVILVCVLTALTQIGGVVYLICLSFRTYIHNIISHCYIRVAVKVAAFVILYTITTFFVVPLIAPIFGRVQLPMTEKHHLKPLTFLTCVLNRNYVRPELRDAMFKVAEEMNNQFPGTVVNYLDGNFPFINEFPLFPHLSHNDGRKLDLSFYYKDAASQQLSNNNPSIIGYGICEEALPGEKNTALFCEQNGYVQYSFLKAIIPQGNKRNYTFDAQRTAALVELLTRQATIRKIFIEPHLKTRMNITSDKIRFHGCQAVRHDDHIHVQL